MCGRFSLGTTNLEKEYSLYHSIDIPPRFNICPLTDIPVILATPKGNQLSMMRWGFQYHFDEKTTTIINAKSETLETKKSFAPHIKTGRCLIPATGFYEWRDTKNGKIPYYIHLEDQNVFSFAGLYRKEIYTDKSIYCTVILTTEANNKMKSIHSRMPAIIKRADEKLWLEGSKATALSLLKPLGEKEIQFHTVSKEVNNTRNQSKEITTPFSWEIDI